MDITPPPAKSIATFIRELKAIRLEDFEEVGDFQIIVSEIAKGVDEKDKEFSKAIPVIFDLFERFPDHDFGAPGPLVHMVEKHGNYEDELLDSIKRKPATMTFVLLHRLLDSKLSKEKRKIYTDAYLSILANPKTSKAVIEILEDWVNSLIDEDYISQDLFEEYQAKKPAPNVKTVETFISELSHVAEKDQKKLSRLLKSIGDNVKVEDAAFSQAIPVVYSFFEKHAAYENLYPLTGMLRTSKKYIPELKKSLQRKPSVEAVAMMIDVFWEEKISETERKECSDIYRAVLTHPQAPAEAIAKAKEYMDAMVKKKLMVD
jgi:hypothetical protein